MTADPSGSESAHGDAHYEDVSAWGLEPTDEEAMPAAQTDCTFIWANREGRPVEVIMSLVWRRGGATSRQRQCARPGAARRRR